MHAHYNPLFVFWLELTLKGCLALESMSVLLCCLLVISIATPLPVLVVQRAELELIGWLRRTWAILLLLVLVVLVVVVVVVVVVMVVLVLVVKQVATLDWVCQVSKL